MHQVIKISGEDAIKYASIHDCSLCGKNADGIQDDLSVEEALLFMKNDSSSVFIDVALADMIVTDQGEILCKVWIFNRDLRLF